MTQNLHVELSNRCVLKCPGCPRTWFSQTLQRPVPKHDLNLAHFAKFLDCQSGSKITHFTLEGNHGDTIYSPQFFEFLGQWRAVKRFHIVTNGSGQKQNFWRQLADTVSDQDQITFSIDGLEDTNHLYRINSNWQSIMTGLKIMIQSPAHVIWKTIVFKHNQHQLAHIRDFALSLGIEDFRVIRTARFGDDNLKPTPDLIDSNLLYDLKQNVQTIQPGCRHGRGPLYVSPEGYAWPCCWISSYFTLYKTDLWKERQQWNIEYHNMDMVLARVEQFADRQQNNVKESHAVCKMHCGKVDH